MSTGLITELMFNALDSLPVILFTVFHQTLVPVPCFLFSLRTACTWLLRVSSFILACRSAFTSQYFLVFLFLMDPDGTQVFNQWRHTRGSHEDTFTLTRGKHSWNFPVRALSSKWIALVISSQDSKLLQTPVSSLCSVSIFRCSHLWNSQSTCQV